MFPSQILANDVPEQKRCATLDDIERRIRRVFETGKKPVFVVLAFTRPLQREVGFEEVPWISGDRKRLILVQVRAGKILSQETTKPDFGKSAQVRSCLWRTQTQRATLFPFDPGLEIGGLLHKADRGNRHCEEIHT